MTKYETNERGFYYLDIVDRYQNKIRVQQSSCELTDVWLFIKEAGLLGKDDNDILLTTENVKEINKFVKFLKRN